MEMLTATLTHASGRTCRRLDNRFNVRQRDFASFDSGWALAQHSCFDHASGDFRRTEHGELVYRMKYCYDRVALESLAAQMVQRIKDRLAELNVDVSVFSAIIPVPPSKLDRPYQPVIELAKRVAEELGLNCDTEILYKEGPTVCVKGFNAYRDKVEHLRHTVKVRDTRYSGQRVLVIDDIIDSGATLDTVATALKVQGNIDRVYVLCATETLGKK